MSHISSSEVTKRSGKSPWGPLMVCLCLLSMIFAGGCASPLKLSSTPPGATVYVDGASRGVTPMDLELPGRDNAYELRVEKEGFQAETVQLRTNENRKEYLVELSPLRMSRQVEFTSKPVGATLEVGGRVVGKTPVVAEVTFVRGDKAQPWAAVPVRLSLRDHQTEEFTIKSDCISPQAVELALLREERTFIISYKSNQDQPLEPQVVMDAGAPVTAPKSVTLEFSRKDKRSDWSTHALVAEIPGIYLPQSALLEHTGNREVQLVLSPVTEVAVPRYFPLVDMGATGAFVRVDASARIGAINVGEDASELQSLARVTRFDRRDPATKQRLQALNSYAVSPDGQFLILAVTMADDAGGFYSNLFLKRADDEGGGLARLTEGVRNMDTHPVIAPDGSNVLVFQSNRSERAKPDIFLVKMVDNRCSGGIARITSDSRFNYCPTYADSNREIVYLSVEASYALAKPQIGTVHFDGSLPTQLQMVGSEVSHREIDKIYYVREDEASGRKQIYSMMPDGKLETLLISDEAFRDSNCQNPQASFSTPRRVLFVSDKEKDAKGRPQNDIYVMNADGTNIQRLTSNLSDDILPCWSPTEPDVVYFMSNRGGAYNVWRFRLPSSR